ncbi:MAG TPA: ATP-binding protein, partial [Tabrizicola sp.]
ISALVLYRQIGMRAAAEHRLSENLYRVFDAKPDAILITDNDRRILWKNMAAAELFGVSVTKAPDVYPLDHYFPGIGRRARHGGRHPLDGTSTVDSDSTFRDIIRHALGGTRAVEVTQIRLMGESGHDTTALFVRDISKSQHALRALRRERGLAEAEAERYQRFLAVMSHEIRSPLHAILASLDLASQRPEAAALADLHGIALDAAQIALEEADAVLEIGRAEHEMRRAEPVVFSPVDILRDLVEMNGPSARAAETRLSVEIGPGAEGSVLGLRACFWHAVSNLVGNAVKFTKRGTIVLRLTRTDGTLRVEVADDGPGIAPDMQAAIFRDHYTRNPVPGGRAKGAGLGLGLVVAAVEAMSGQYGVQSAVGQGSTFWFTFPAAPAERQPQVPDLRGAVSLPTGLRVLVVDDAQVNRVLIQQMFSTLGLDADLAASGPEAVAMAEAYAYDLIMMDLSMPDMDGFAAAAAIRRGGASKRSAIVALTANVLARQEVDKPDSDFDGMLLKPLRLDELRHALAAGLHRPSQSRVREAPLVDMSVADDLLKMLPPAAIEPLLTALLDEARDLARDLDQGVPVQGLPARFHRIAGSAGMLGAERLRGLALDAELDCKESARAPTLSFRAAWTQTIAETAREWTSHLAEIAHPVGATFER